MTRASALKIETPEGIAFSLQLASPVARSLAWLVDFVIVTMAASSASKAANALSILSADWAVALGVVLYFVISMGYGMALEWFWRGQTIGKRLVGLRVVDAQGLHLQFPQVALRNLIRAIDMLPAFNLVGGVAALLNRKAQRLGDLAANTVVLREAKFRQPDLEQVAPAKYNSLLAYPHLAARLRNRVSPEAVRLATQAVLLRDGYDPVARVELFSELADYFRGLVEFPTQATEGIGDEQYVRSVLRAIYSR